MGEIKTLLHDPDLTTQKVAKVLLELAKETCMVSAEECNEAFHILADCKIGEVYGGAPSDKSENVQKDAEEPENGPTMY